MTLRYDVPIASLPEADRALFDPACPVPPGIIFRPRLISAAMLRANIVFNGLFAGGLTGCVGGCMLVALTGSISDGYNGVRDIGDGIVLVLLYALFGGLVVIAGRVFWLPLWYDWLALREQRAGTLRRGLFLTPDKLIVRTKTNRCDSLTRDSIASIYYARRRAGRGWQIVYRLPDGKLRTYQLDFPPFNAFTPDEQDVAPIRQWAGIGAAEFTEFSE